MWFNPPTRTPGPPGRVPAGPADGADAADRVDPKSLAWLSAAVAAVLGAAAGAGLLLNGTDVGIVAALRQGGDVDRLGLVFVFWCGASLVGGLLYGALHRPVSPLVLLALMGALTIPMGLAAGPWTLGLLSVAPGLLCAPVLASASERITALVPEARRGEALGWYGSAMTAGSALGAPLTGAVIDQAGPGGGFAAAGGAAVILAAAGLGARSAKKIRRRRRAPAPEERSGGSGKVSSPDQ
jgi:hypothetical protein